MSTAQTPGQGPPPDPRHGVPRHPALQLRGARRVPRPPHPHLGRTREHGAIQAGPRRARHTRGGVAAGGRGALQQAAVHHEVPHRPQVAVTLPGVVMQRHRLEHHGDDQEMISYGLYYI